MHGHIYHIHASIGRLRTPALHRVPPAHFNAKPQRRSLTCGIIFAQASMDALVDDLNEERHIRNLARRSPQHRPAGDLASLRARPLHCQQQEAALQLRPGRSSARPRCIPSCDDVESSPPYSTVCTQQARSGRIMATAGRCPSLSLI